MTSVVLVHRSEREIAINDFSVRLFNQLFSCCVTGTVHKKRVTKIFVYHFSVCYNIDTCGI